jgi:hypothetical protein
LLRRPIVEEREAYVDENGYEAVAAQVPELRARV